jgi:hypothetical protein
LTRSSGGGLDSEQRMLGGAPGDPALGRGPAPEDDWSRHDYHVAVGKLLGRQVSYASVEWCLRMGVRGPAPWAVRIRPGWYRLN